MLTTSHDCVPGMRTKWTMRFEPSPSVNESDPSSWSEPITFSATADNSGTVSCGRPIMPAWSAGAARTTPALSTNTAEIPAAAEIAHDLRHPVEIDAGNDDRILLTIDRRYRIGRHHDRPVAGFGE